MAPFAALLLPAVLAAAPKTETAVFLSPSYIVDKKYSSMKGPQSTQDVSLLSGTTPQLLWITGYDAVMVSSDGVGPQLQEFMCHSNLDMDAAKHRVLFGGGSNPSPRLFTLSQGQTSIRFPEGYGVPVMSDEPLALTTQVLNHNIEGKVFLVRHKVTISFVRDSELKEPMRPLVPVGAYGLALIDGKDGYYGVDRPDEVVHGKSCLPGTNASTHVYTDPFGRVFTGHWVVKPGREVNRTLVSKLMALPYDTRVHYIAVHLHPFAESLELVDLTTKKTVFRSSAQGFPDKVGLDRVEHYASPEGTPLFKNHEYQMISVYNNTTAKDQDSMAVMYLYVLDKSFRRPKGT
jgi:hypothetical protein